MLLSDLGHLDPPTNNAGSSFGPHGTSTNGIAITGRLSLRVGK